MARARRMRTQEIEYWHDEYAVSEADLDFLTGVILEGGRPRPLENLVSLLVARLIQRDKDRAARQFADENVYRPTDTHQVGQTLVFTELDLAPGTVTAVRSGQNARYGSFSVIRVSMQETGEEREFASSFSHVHPLNRPVEDLIGGTDANLTEAEILEASAPVVGARLSAALEARSEWVRFNGTWFLEALLPEISALHLNLAEAVIDQARRPLPADEMLNALDLDEGGPRDAVLFALNHALGQDQRFDNVARDDRQIWYLRALMPAAVFERPIVSRTPIAPSGDELIGLTMLDMVEELGDELDSIPNMRAHQSSVASFQLNFPHRYAGTMPAPQELLSLFEYAPGRHFDIALVDGRTGRTFTGWVIPAEGYIAGLSDWYKGAGLVVGSIISVTPGPSPQSLSLSCPPKRGGGSEWVRVATVQDGALVIQNQPRSIGARYDADTLVEVTDPEAVARLMWQSQQTSRSLTAVVRTVFSELAKLSPQGVAHCKTIYTAVNMYRRSGAVPVFALLTRNACFDPVGQGRWAYDPSLEGRVYETPDEMRERPLSHRSDLLRDQVVRYAGL